MVELVCDVAAGCFLRDGEPCIVNLLYSFEIELVDVCASSDLISFDFGGGVLRRN